MGDEIRTEDTQEGRTMGWHKKTIVNPGLTLDNCHLNRWDVQPVEISARFADGTDIPLPVGDKWEALVTVEDLKGDEKVLFVSTPYNRATYTPLPNKTFLQIIRDALLAASLSMDVESCGSVFNRRRVFVSIPLPGGETFEAGGRSFKGFINFMNSFDMSCPFMVTYSNICIVCNNTFSANMDIGGLVVQHSKNMAANLTNVPAIVARAIEMQEEFRGAFLALASRQVSLEEAKALLVSFLCDRDTLSTRSFKDAEEMTLLFLKGAGNNGENLADVFSALTDFYSHLSAGKDAQKQFQSSEFGAGALAKRQALAFLSPLVEDSGEFKAQVQRGQALLLAYFDGQKAKLLSNLDAQRAKLLGDAPKGAVAVVDAIPIDAAPVQSVEPAALPVPDASKDAAPVTPPPPAKGKAKGKGKKK